MIEPFYAERLFNQLYANINGYEVSIGAQDNFKGDTKSLIYGELPFETCQNIINQIQPKSNGVFFDLGSGTGRIAMTAHLLHNFRKSIGVELLDGLHDKACEIKNTFEIDLLPPIRSKFEGSDLQFLKANIFDVDLSEADFVFINHPFKGDQLFDDLETKLISELKPGTKLVTIIRHLRNPAFKSLGSKNYKFSWGNSTAHFAEVA